MTNLQKAYALVDQAEHDIKSIKNPFKNSILWKDEAKQLDLELAKITKLINDGKKTLHDLVLQEASKR